MSDFPALIRTYVPLGVAWLVGWLASLGIDVSGDAKDALTFGIGTVVAMAYYTVVKKLERKFPWVTVFLGSSQQPVAYAPSLDAVPKVDAAAVEPVLTDVDWQNLKEQAEAGQNMVVEVSPEAVGGKHAAPDELAPLDGDELAPLDDKGDSDGSAH